MFRAGSHAYSSGVGRVISRKAVMMGVYLVLGGSTFGLFKAVPGGFVPGQDKQYLVGFAQLPDAVTLDRTEDVIRRMSDIALKHPGVESAVAFPWPVDQRLHQQLECRHRLRHTETLRTSARQDSPARHRQQLNGKFAAIEEAFVAIFPPPPVQGLGTIGGFKLQIEDRDRPGLCGLG